MTDTVSKFVPVLLGTETNAYNMARAFHEAYGIRSFAFGRYPLSDTANSDFVEVHCDPDFTDPERFIEILNAGGEKDKNNSGTESIYARKSFIGRLTYDYDGNLLIPVTEGEVTTGDAADAV